MKLADWIEADIRTRSEIAYVLDISSGHLTDLIHGRFWPSRKTWQRIWEVSDGKVTPNDHLWDKQ